MKRCLAEKEGSMAEKSLKKNYFYSLAYQILTLITPFITTPYVSRVLGANGIGISSYVTAVVFYFTLVAALGTATIGQREVAYHRDSLMDRSVAFWNAECLKILSVVVALVVYAVFISFQTENAVYYKILVLNILNVAFDVVWFFQGMEEFQKIVFRNFVFRILGIAYLFLFVRTAEDVDVFILGTALTTFLGSISLWGYLPRYICRIPWKSIDLRKTLTASIRLFIPTLAVSVYVVLDKVMLGWFTTDYVENGNYEQAMKIAKMSLMFIMSFSTVVTPRIGYYFFQKQFEEMKALMFKSYRFVWLITLPICFGLWGTAGNFVPWFFGPGFDEVVSILFILAMLVPLQGLTVVSGGQYLVQIQQETQFTYSVIAGAVTNLVLNLILIPKYYAMGAAAASIIGEAVVLAVQFHYVGKTLSISQAVLSARNYLVAAILMFALLWGEGRQLTASIAHTFLMISSGTVLYFAILFAMKDEAAKECMMLVRKKAQGVLKRN